MDFPPNCRDLHDVGRDWVKESLSAGGPLSQRLLSTMQLRNGTMYVLGLSRDNRDEAPQLDHGIGDPSVLSLDRSATSLLELLIELDQPEGSLGLLVENDLAKPTDPAVAVRTDTVFVQESVYHLRYLTDLETPSDLIQYLGTSASGYPLDAFVIRGLDRDALMRALRKDPADLVTRVDAIVNTVFDCEGFSVWIPSGVLAKAT